ncbi:hypothetical protein [Psychrobacter sp. I-STPA10]|uniref:hypothetical protein n=1 Tax=Psychrobacter sp. I-STPA10 TaxID=2585769 RepID=UPI001E28EA06|nr:hypothetical protein [Psychrobacter sp. I-STPA10]
MTIKSMATTFILLGSFVMSQQALAQSNGISRQQAANPNNFSANTNTKELPKSISHCSGTLLSCAVRVLSDEWSGMDSDVQLGKYISMAQVFIYPQAQSKPDIGVVVITEEPYGEEGGDDSVSATRYRLAFVEQTNRQGNPYWKFISHRQQWQCARPGSDGSWSKRLCP